MSNDLLKPQNGSARMALRTREAARALGVSERTLWAWTKRGLIPYAKCGGTYMYSTEALAQWLREHTNRVPEGGAA